MRRKFFRLTWLFVLALLACHGAKEANSSSGNSVSAKTNNKGAAMEKKFSEPKSSIVDANRSYEALIETEKGNIRVKLFAKEAPLSVTNFIQLAKGGFYEGLTFHRVEPGFVIQGGDPLGNGTGGPGYTVPSEIGQPHLKGALAWARTGDEVNPERRSSGSQFYITLEATPFLDGGYTVFGQTIDGMDVVEKIRRGDKITKITIEEK